MAIRGQVIDTPVAGDRIVFHETKADSQGRRLVLEVIIKPGAQGPPEHIHPLQEERFEVLSGRVGARVGGNDRVLGVGDTLTVLPERPTVGGRHLRWRRV